MFDPLDALACVVWPDEIWPNRHAIQQACCLVCGGELKKPKAGPMPKRFCSKKCSDSRLAKRIRKSSDA